VDVADTDGKICFGLAAMEDRYIVALLVKQTNCVRADEARSTKDEASHTRSISSEATDGLPQAA